MSREKLDCHKRLTKVLIPHIDGQLIIKNFISLDACLIGLFKLQADAREVMLLSDLDKAQDTMHLRVGPLGSVASHQDSDTWDSSPNHFMVICVLKPVVRIRLCETHETTTTKATTASCHRSDRGRAASPKWMVMAPGQGCASGDSSASTATSIVLE